MRTRSAIAELTAFADPIRVTLGETNIRRPTAAAPTKDGPRINEEIRAPRVLLIDATGEKQGEMPLAAALEAAVDAGMDLVEIAGSSNPPVVKILDFGKFKFQ